MDVTVGYGDSYQNVDIAPENLMGIMKANTVKYDLVGAAEVQRALDAPIGTATLHEIVMPGESIAIITSDITRPLPTWEILPPILEELYRAGIKKSDISIVLALGSHRMHTEEEKRRLVGPAVYGDIRVVDSLSEEMVSFGKTMVGTPVDINQTVAEADRRICLGNVEYHYFAGYSGGAKAIMPGVSTPGAISVNHALMVDPLACAGNLDTNPVRLDIEEAARMVGVDFLVNVVLDEEKQIIKACAGDVVAAHREACRFLDSLYRIDIPHRADIVIDSQGGSPKDLNLYQTQKALDNSKYAVRPGGIVILVGSCKEGLGNACFGEWMHAAQTPQDIIDRLQTEFVLGGHKAAAVAKIQMMADVFLVSDLNPDLARDCFFTPFETLQDAYDEAVRRIGFDAQVLVMPHGGSTVPHVIGE